MAGGRSSWFGGGGGAPDGDGRATNEEGVELTSFHDDDLDGDPSDPSSLAASASLSLADVDDLRSTRRYYARSSRHTPVRRCWVFTITVVGVSLALTSVFYLKGHFVHKRPSHSAFDLESVSPLAEYGSMMLVYNHKLTNAKLAAMVPTQPTPGQDKTFGIGFRTKPTSSNGVAHILEHSVLCGSRKYMTKDPFVYLLKGSLHTFLNAFTYPDRTLYPVASRNHADFLNLVDVYLDAVFNPRCVTEEGWWVLRQEGWRYVQSDEDGSLEVRGVVQSEMLGALSDPDEVLYQLSQSLLFPDNTYRYNSGGDPGMISSLTREEYVKFYEGHYHPTNSKTFVHGDAADVEAVMDLMDGYMRNYENNPKSWEDSRIPFQEKKFEKPMRERGPYPSSGDDDGDGESGGGGRNVLITWLLDDQNSKFDDVTDLALRVLDDMMLGAPTSPLQKALLDSELGEEVLDDGIDDTLLQTTFQVGMKGLQKEGDVANVEQIIMDTLHALEHDGFDGDDIEASLNSIEFDLREFKTSGPRGISFYTKTMSKWNYDIDPVEALAFESKLTKLKDIISDSGPAIFQSLIRDLLLDNPHRVVLYLYPDPSMEAHQLEMEKSRMKQIMEAMGPGEVQKIIEEAKSVEEIQSQDDPPEAIAAIPTLSLSDLDRNEVEYPNVVTENAYGSKSTLATHEVASSGGIVYVDLGLDISQFPNAHIPYLPLFERLLLETGTSERTDVALDREIGIHTGGIDVDFVMEEIAPDGTVERVVTDGSRLRTYLFLRGKCLASKIDMLVSLFADILSNTKLKDSRNKAKQILKEEVSEIESNIQSDGDSYARRRILARYSVPGFLEEQMRGVSQLATLKSALDAATKKDSWPEVSSVVESMRMLLLGSSEEGAILNVSGDRQVLSSVEGKVKAFLTEQLPRLSQNLPADAKYHPPDLKKNDHPWVDTARDEMKKSAPIKDEGIVCSTKVNYVGRGGIMYSVGDAMPGSSSVVSRHIQNGYLWDTVRVKNGAYGAMSYLYLDGISILLSYRDPNLAKTLEAYDGAAEYVLDEVSSGTLLENDGAALSTAIIGAIGHHDGRALFVDEIGWVALMRWLRNESAETRDKWRGQILDTKDRDFADYALRLKNMQKPSMCIVGSQSAFETEAPDVTVIMSV